MGQGLGYRRSVWAEQSPLECRNVTWRWDCNLTCFSMFPSSLLSHPQLVEGNFALFCTYTLDFRNEFQNLLLAIMVRVGSGLMGSRWKTG